MNRIPKVKIIKVGTITQEASEIPSTLNLQLKSELGIGGGSTVTLITVGQRILVDTGYDYEWMDTRANDKRNTMNLNRALETQRISPGDIDIVFITHWHRDHFGNLGIFKNARRMASKSMVKRFGLGDFIGVDEGEEIGEGVKVVLTPGHTAEHASILVDTKLGGVKARVAIAGDAIISQSYFQAGRIWKNNADFSSVAEAKESISRLVSSSDIIIPGHGVPFMTYQPGVDHKMHPDTDVSKPDKHK